MATRDVAFAAYVEQRRPQLYRVAWLLCGDAHLDETRRPWRRETAAGHHLPESSVAAAPVEEHDALWTARRLLRRQSPRRSAPRNDGARRPCAFSTTPADVHLRVRRN